MKMIRDVLFFMAGLVFFAEQALGFNAAGHKIIAEIAWQKLTSEERSQIVEILKKHPRFDEDFKEAMEEEVGGMDTQTKDHFIFVHASIWPDIARGFEGDLLGTYHRPRWHYINLPVFLSQEQADAFSGALPANIAFDVPGGGDEKMLNGVQATKRCLAKLTSTATTNQERAICYSWLMHVVPDLAQPLHAASLFSTTLFPEGDKGGNSIKIRKEGTSAGGQSLHSVWDARLGRSGGFTQVRSKAVQIISEFDDEFNAPFVALPFDVWATESQQLALLEAYTPILAEIEAAEEDGEGLSVIDVQEEYFVRAGKVCQRQAVVFGVRLASLLRATLPSEEGRHEIGGVAFNVGFPVAIPSPSVRHGARRALKTSPRSEEETTVNKEQNSSVINRVKKLEAQLRVLRMKLEHSSLQEIEDDARLIESTQSHDRDGEQCDCAAH